MTSPSLFPEPELTVVPDAQRQEPGVWVRRLWVQEDFTPSAARLRAVEFQPGLNIICTAKRGATEKRTVGHSVGKTLLVRLIRYCLGEQHVGPTEDRRALAGKWPKGYVFAEVRAASETWTVAKPIGFEGASASWAIKGADPDGLFAENGPRLKWTDFVQTVETAVAAPAFDGIRLPYADRPASWRDLLAWLSRDQKCRYRRHHEWRDPEAESGTVALHLEDASLVIRATMGLLDKKERRLRDKHRALLTERSDLERQIADLTAYLERSRQTIKELLRFSDAPPALELFGGVALSRAQEMRKRQERLLADVREKQGPPVAAQRLEVAKLAVSIAALEEELPKRRAEAQAMQLRLQQLEAADKQTYYANFAPATDEWCPYYGSKDAALAAGCPVKAETVPAGQRDPHHQRAIDEQKATLESFQEEVAQKAEQLAELQREHARQEGALNSQAAKYDAAVTGIQQAIADYTALANEAKRFTADCAELDKLKSNLKAKDRQIAESLDEQERARQRVESQQTKLSGYFSLVLQSLLESSAGGEIVIKADGIYPQAGNGVATKGEAIGTFATILGFDLACLIASVAGLGHHPRLLIHDSPREADMEEEMYFRLFRMMARLHDAFKGRKPSFQYIVTTTTRPPDELAAPPWVRLELDARKPEGLLLGERF